MPRVHLRAPVQPWGRLKSEGGWLNNLLAWSRLRSPCQQRLQTPCGSGRKMGVVGMGPPDMGVPTPLLLLGGCCHHGSAFPPHHPVGWLQGETRLRGDSRWHGKEKPKPLQPEQPPPRARGRLGGDKHTSECRDHQEKGIKESLNVFATEKRKSRLLRLP